jgi:AraC family transcriptional regulator of adaptative response / DNA-3-methyladenine glycosylase II
MVVLAPEDGPPLAAVLPARAPFDGAGVLAFLAARAIPGVEEVGDGTYRRVLELAGGPAVLAATPRDEAVHVALWPAVPDDAVAGVAIAGAIFGCGADPAAVAAALGNDSVLGPLLAARPGLRVPGTADGFEVAVRAILGQQITVAAARTLAARLVARVGVPLAVPSGGLTHRFPTRAALADAPSEALAMPRTRADALRALGASGLPLGAPGDAAALTALRGVGAWTAGYVALRLGDPDVFLPTDVVVRHALADLGADPSVAERWRPFRSLAVLHLWRHRAG